MAFLDFLKKPKQTKPEVIEKIKIAVTAKKGNCKKNSQELKRKKLWSHLTREEAKTISVCREAEKRVQEILNKILNLRTAME
jgi:hypothetical protein